jgi:uncharacterized protein (TIGR02646 family)
MKQIVKEKSPLEFEEWKTKNQLTESHLLKKSKLNRRKKDYWEKFTKKTVIKNKVKETLLEEQGFICCYCQQRVYFNNKTIIEHFIARDNDATKMFNYENIFACCDGGQGERTDKNENQENALEFIPKYCGHEKDNDTISINPLDDDCESHFSYTYNDDAYRPEITIEGITIEGQQAVEKLNLDIPKLRRLRGDAVVGFLFEIIVDENDNENYIPVPIENIKHLLPNIKQKIDKKFYPFCVVLEQVLKKHVS